MQYVNVISLLLTDNITDLYRQGQPLPKICETKKGTYSFILVIRANFNLQLFRSAVAFSTGFKPETESVFET